MSNLLVGVLAFVLVFAGYMLFTRLNKPKPAASPLNVRLEKGRFTLKVPVADIEAELYWRLVEALPECIILTQVAISSLLSLPRGIDSLAWENGITRLTASFVVCDRSFKVIGVVEIDGGPQRRPDQKEVDIIKDKAFRSAGLSIIRVPAKRIPPVAELRVWFFPSAYSETMRLVR